MNCKRYSSSCSFCGIILQTVFSIKCTNHINSSTLHTLKQVWKADSLKDTATPSASLTFIKSEIIQSTIDKKGSNKISTQSTPKTLNMRCAKAARRACVLAVNAARLAVIVVPIFSPNTKAAPSSKLIHPLAHIISVMAMVAAEACTIMVSSVPINTNSKTEKKPMSV